MTNQTGDSVTDFPRHLTKPWMRPQPDFEEDAYDFVEESPGAWDRVEGLRSCASPFIRAAIILQGCNPDDIPFLLRIAAALDKGDLKQWSFKF
jgi:hypothetical protein